MNRFVFILILIPFISLGQLIPDTKTNIPQAPRPANLTDVNKNSRNQTNQNNNSHKQTFNVRPQPTQREINQSTYLNPFKAKKDLTEIEKLKFDLYTMQTTEHRINFNIPSYENAYPNETKPYRDAFNEINKIVSGEQKTDIAKAIFITENAYMGNQQSYEQFDNMINEIANFCLSYMKANNLDMNNNLVKNMMLYRLLADTLELNDKEHLPVEYDFDDYMGREDWTKMFVTKLLTTNSGQCHSMPLLYLAVADRIGAEAFLSFAPSHSYIKFRDKYDNWYNVELTNGRLTSDAFIIGSGYIKTEAIRSGIYMDTIGTKKVLGHIMTDLSKGYSRKFGLDKFTIEMINRSLEIFPNNIYGLMQKSDYYTVLFQQFIERIPKPYPNPQQLQQQYPIVYDAYAQRNAMYDLVDGIGYEPMPDEVYQTWLKSVGDEVNKRQHDEQEKRIMKVINVNPEKR